MLEVKDLKKNFGKTKVIKGISFDVQKGEVVVSNDRDDSSNNYSKNNSKKSY